MTPGEDDASYKGTQIGGELHDTLDISDGHTRRKDDDILRHSAVCIEIDMPADMNCTVVELNDVTILRRRLPQGQDSAEHYECYISHTRRKDDDILRHSAVCVEIDVPADMNCTTAPWDAGGTQNDKLHEAMCRAMVHNGDRSTTKNTKCEPTTKMLLDANCPRLKMTPGEGDASYGGTQIEGELQDTLAISDGHTRRKHDNILCRCAVCVEIDIPAVMNCTAVELNDVTILRRDCRRDRIRRNIMSVMLVFPIRQSNSMT